MIFPTSTDAIRGGRFGRRRPREGAAIDPGKARDANQADGAAYVVVRRWPGIGEFDATHAFTTPMLVQSFLF